MTIEIDIVSHDFLKKLSGSKRKKEIKEWLIANSYNFEMGKDGWPKVLNTYINHRLGGVINDSVAKPQQRRQGNAAALIELMRER